MLLLIDNYDSFSYNLYQLIGSVEPDIKVIRNDAMTIKEIDELNPEAIIISPGPGRPEDAGVCIDVVKELGSKYVILGVCLGHQSICAAYGATVTYAKQLMHGKQSMTKVDNTDGLFKGLDEMVPVARYHSLAADPDTMPDCLKITALTDDGEVMAVKHKEYDVYGVQFHPESIMTPDGKKMLKNFVDIAKAKKN
ncbi:MAG: aminodeoxychorismate/anthranilate synthase component II [Clostridia bacterium]|nr:aminodeoxychorismate/anthranilate synthase component II [Clostridia bacterium]